MKKISIIITTTLLLLSIDAIACSSAVDKETKKEKVSRLYNNADTIFVGNLVSKEILNDGNRWSSAEPVRYTFEVIEWFKGKSSAKKIEVITARMDASCGYNFKLGITYLVHSELSNNFPTRFPQYLNEKEANTSGSCYGNIMRRNLDKKSLKIYKRLSKS